MTFLTPLAGLIAAAVAVPALLLLYFLKLRRREERVPSTVLWRKAIQDLQVNAPFQRLRRNLLLLLQLLVLAALALALSQPSVPFRPTAGERSVLLIDRSGSMSIVDADERGRPGTGTRLDEAKRRANSLLDTLPSGGQAMVIAFDDRAEIMQGFTSDRTLLKRTIDAITPSDRRTRLKLAYQLADAQGAMRAAGTTEMVKPPQVWVYSDGRVLDGGEVSLRSEVRYEKIGSDTTKNVGVVSLSARRNYERPTEVQVFTRLSNSGPEPVELDVQLTVDGKLTRVARVSLPPERWTEQQRQDAERNGFAARDAAEFTLEMPEAGVVRVEQMLTEGDGLKADDAASVVVPPPKTLSVLLVTEGTNPFMARLIRALELKNATEMTPAQYEAATPTDKDVVIFDNYRPKKLPGAADANPSATRPAETTATGNFIYFGVLPDGLRLRARTGQGGAMLVDDDVQTVLDWKRDHPIVRGLALGKLYAQGAISLMPATESEVLVEGVGGPLVVLHREGRSTHVAVAFDPLNSNWPLLMSWPMFMHNTLQYIATSSDLSVRESYPPGATPRLPRSALGDALGDGRTLTVSGPQGVGRITVDVPQGAGDIALPALERVGVYELDPPVAGFERLAVNLLDAGESDVKPADAPPGGIGTTVQAQTSKARLELWWWLVLAAALPLLVLEWYVYTRRTHL